VLSIMKLKLEEFVVSAMGCSVVIVRSGAVLCVVIVFAGPARSISWVLSTAGLMALGSSLAGP